VHEVSRGAWGLRLRRTKQRLALSPLLMLPSAHIKDVGVRNDLFGAEYPPRLSPVYASLGPSRYQCKTQGQVDRYSFLVRLFHPLLHAGLSRRTNKAITLTENRPDLRAEVKTRNRDLTSTTTIEKWKDARFQ
jgi:hypothetical protein